MIKIMSKKQFEGYIKNCLRNQSYKWPARNEARNRARVERGKYKCAMCGGLFSNKEIAMDHIVPVVDPVKGFTTWDSYIERLFVGVDGWQVLCKEVCHRAKTKTETEKRVAARKAAKQKKRKRRR